MRAALCRLTSMSTSLHRGPMQTSRRRSFLTGLHAQTRGTCPKSVARSTSVADVVHLQPYQEAKRRCFSSQKGGQEHHEEFLKQMQELQSERETLFGFTDDDRNGWTNSKDHQFDQSFLEEMNHARDHQFSGDTSSPTISLSSGADKKSESDIIAETVPVQDSPSSFEHHNNNVGLFAGLSHLSSNGASVHMVNVGDKKVTARVAVAQSKVILPDAVIKAFLVQQQDDNKENHHATDLVGPKGPIFATAKVAGIMAAKKTSELIPLCHPLPLDSVNIDISLHGRTVTIQCECRLTHKTGVEMEALMGASVAALTIYDMTKAVSHDIEISQTRLLRKSGGKRTFLHQDADGDEDKIKL